MSQTNRVSIRYARNSAWMTRASPLDMQEMLRTEAEFTGAVETVESEGVRSDRMVQGLFEVGRSGQGSFTGELAYGQFDTWLEDVLCGTWTSPVSITATDIDFASADSSINRESGSFITDGVVAGMHILVGGSAANSTVHKVESVTALKIVSDQAITTEAVGPSITIKNGGMLRNGVVERSGTIEEAYLDDNLFYVYDDVRPSRLQLEIAPKSLVKATFGFVCREWSAPAGTTAANSVAAVNSNLAFNTSRNVEGILEGGATLDEIILALSLSIDNGVEAVNGVGYQTAALLPYRTQRITGNLELYHSATVGAYVTKFRAQTATALSFRMTNGNPALYYVVTLAAAKYTGGTPKAGGLDGNVGVPLPFTAYAGADDWQIQFDRISAA